MFAAKNFNFPDAISNTPQHCENVYNTEKKLENVYKYIQKLYEYIIEYSNYSKKLRRVSDNITELLDKYSNEYGVDNQSLVICNNFIKSTKSSFIRTNKILVNEITKPLENICKSIINIKENKKKTEKQKLKVENMQDKFINSKVNPVKSVSELYYNELNLLSRYQCDYLINISEIEQRVLLMINNSMNLYHEIFEMGKSFMKNNFDIFQSIQEARVNWQKLKLLANKEMKTSLNVKNFAIKLPKIFLSYKITESKLSMFRTNYDYSL
ncbi:hypothetical protein A3Q56_04831 [Intoshia linei]|uniref:Uncharacterized protein n=1 Tax=Intoshia linei TaxID=1819745 RepID=A0A177AZF9_9BILA|nr:hypothetical protein A3Q56_04831 [Intoshia linei]